MGTPAKISKFEKPSPEEIPSSLHFTANSIVYSENAQTDITGFNSGNITVAGDVYTKVNSVVNHLPAEKKPVTSFRNTCPAPVSNFVGREDLLCRMHSLFESCATKTKWRERTVIIHGLGGMGKSELARKYVDLHINDEDSIIPNVAWIDSETKTSLEVSFQKIAEELELDIKKDDAKKIAASVYKHFSKNCEAGLFIFDNVEQLEDEEPYFGISEYLPTSQYKKLPLILITSRTSDFEAPKGQNNAIGIPVLDEDQAVELLITKLGLDKNQKEYKSIEAAARKLNEFIQGLPLALILAASYIRFRISGKVADEVVEEVGNYINRFENPKSGWSKDELKGGLKGNYKLVMNTVWEATFNKIESMGDEGKCALTLLNIMAYLPTDNLRKSLVDDILAFGYSSLKEHSKVGYFYLETFSLASRTDGGEKSKIRIHRLVQRCTWERLKDAGKSSFLVNIGWYLCENFLDEEDTMRLIHRDLKERNWPENSFRISIIFLSLHWTDLFKVKLRPWSGEKLTQKQTSDTPFALELARDLYKAIEADVHAYGDSLKEGYFTLLGMLLYIVSEASVDPDWNEDEVEAFTTLSREWNDKYKEAFEESAKILINPLTSKDFLLASELCSEVQQEISNIMAPFSTISLLKDDKVLRIKVRDSLTKALNEVKFTFTSENLSTVSRIYKALNVFDSNEPNTNSALALKAALQLHFQCYTSDISVTKEEYWKWMNDCRLYRDLNSELKKSQLGRTSPDSATPWEKSIVDAFLTHSGLQVVQQHLGCIDDCLQLCPGYDFIEFILRLITVYNCSEALKETPSFLYSLREKTTGVISSNWWLLVWLTLFPPNHEFQDKEGEKWSLNCVTEEIDKFVEDGIDFEMTWKLSYNGLDEDALISCLLPHFEFDGHGLRFKAALAGMVTLWSQNQNGAAGKFTHVLHDVWKATFDELKSKGAAGECALTLLNIVAFRPCYNNEMKSQVNKILEFVYSQRKYCINEGLKCLQSLSLIIIGDDEIKKDKEDKMKKLSEESEDEKLSEESEDEKLSEDENNEKADAKIFVPEHLQRFCRQRLHSGDHPDLLSIWRYLCQYEVDPDGDFNMHLIHGIYRHFKERNRPSNAVQPSIIFLSRHWDYDKSPEMVDLLLELANYLKKVLDDDEHSHSPLLEDGYRTLLRVSLYLFSENQYDKLPRRKNNPVTLDMGWKIKYANALDESVELFTNFLMSQDSFCSSTVSSEVLERITSVLECVLEKADAFITIRIKIRDSVLEALNRTTITAQHSDAISKIYKALNVYDPDELSQKAALGLKAALQLHFQFSLNGNSGVLENQDYWTNGPIRYRHLHWALRKSKEKRTTLSAASEWEKSIVNAFIAHEGGPKVVQQSLSCGDDYGIIRFVTFLVTEHNCAENFKETPSFLHSLKENTSRANDDLKANYLLLWLALFPPGDTEGRKWSLSMAEDMKTFLDYYKEPRGYLLATGIHFNIWIADFGLDNDTVIRALRPHLNLSESSGQESLSFKTAVALMDGDICHRKHNDKSTEGWETLFRDHFNTPDRTPEEILKVGKKYGFI